uniref:Uncharacterized protein n=1 Tax=Arundo donax TaxID=35708 RepID=A0A0A9DQD9_ARUDO
MWFPYLTLRHMAKNTLYRFCSCTPAYLLFVEKFKMTFSFTSTFEYAHLESLIILSAVQYDITALLCIIFLCFVVNLFFFLGWTCN